MSARLGAPPAGGFSANQRVAARKPLQGLLVFVGINGYYTYCVVNRNNEILMLDIQLCYG
jgi:hypothetical protein